MGIVKKFEKIKVQYDKFHSDLLKSGRLPHKDTGIGYWGVTPVTEAFELFNKIGLHRYENFLDLGCGDGRIVLLASIFDINSHGIEFDSELIKFSEKHKNEIGLNSFENTQILQKDFFDHDISSYDVVYVNPDQPFVRNQLDKKIMNELSGKLIVHGWEFQPNFLKKESEHIINGEKFIIYTK